MHGLTIARKSEIGMILVTLIWGFGFPVTQIAIDYNFGTFTIMTSRFLIGMLMLSIFFHRRFKLLNKIYFISGTITGIFLFLGFYLQVNGLVYTSSANNAFLTQLAVVFTPFIFWLIFKKYPDLNIFVAAVVSLFGVFLLLGGLDVSFNKGDIMTIGCAVTVSFQVVLAQYYIIKHKLDPVLFTFVQFIVVLILSMSLAIQHETLPIVDSIFNYWPLLFIGALNTAIGFTIQSIAIKNISSTRVSIIVSLEALVGTIGAAFIIGEPITINIIIGGLFIILGIVISKIQMGLPKKKIKFKAQPKY